MTATQQRVLESPWLTPAEAAAYARTSANKVRAALADGSCRGSQITPGGRWRVHRDAVDAWLNGVPYDPSPARITRRSA